MNKVYIIAEVGPNHLGSLKIAKKYVRKLSSINVDAIKFQLTIPDNIYSNDSIKADYQKKYDKHHSAKEMSKSYQLTFEEHMELSLYCKKYNVEYLCTGFDIESLKFLNEKINIKYIKIPSGETLSIDLLNYASKSNKKIILSTGMSDIKGIEESLRLLNLNEKKDKLTILHCISAYPTKDENVNMKFMNEIKKKFSVDVGFSDHTKSNNACLVAVAMGASIIEKHVTLNRNWDGPDHKASATIDQFEKLVKDIRLFEKIIGFPTKTFDSEQKNVMTFSMKSIVSKRKLLKGKIINNDDIVFKRPGNGYKPNEINKVIGKKIKTDIEANVVIKPQMLII